MSGRFRMIPGRFARVVRRTAVEIRNRTTAARYQIVVAACTPQAGAASRLARAIVPGLPPRPLPMYWYRKVSNFGDLLSPDIVAHVSGADPVYVDSGCRGKLLALGSLLRLARPGDVVWGTGALCNERLNGRGIRFLAVRGPRTRALIRGDVPEVYGDPAYLLPLIYQPKPEPRREVGVVAHYKDLDVMFTGDPSVAEIDVTCGDWRRVVDRIVACDVIISSSLHGIIVAEAYGVPAVWVQPTKRLRGGEFKFHDYYAATARQRRPADWNLGIHRLVEFAEPPVPLDPGPLLQAWRRFASESTASESTSDFRDRSP